MTQPTVPPVIANTDELTTEPSASITLQAPNDAPFEEFDLDDIEIIESKVFA
ncbi:hypothetical protein GVN18_01465 [Pseudomonas sp. ODNR1LW]|jgi:hypothetical protein|nr:hypothetical protein [Pseudomonas sp. ODNR1LW]